MSKKTLLEEGTVRRFMKLAEMEPLAGTFINEMFAEEAVYQDDDEPTPEEAEFDTAYEEEGEEEGFEAGEEAAEGEEDLGVDLEDDEAEVDTEGEAGELTLTDEEAEAFLKVADKVRSAMEAAPEGEELEAPDMGGEEELEMGGEEELDMGGEEEFAAEEEIEEEPPAEEEEEELVQEIARRVAKRLLTKKNK